jgi:predicted ATPase
VIDAIRIRQFKCFRDTSVQLRRLSVLTGTNGAGKSTLIQSIILARQASENSDSDVVELNGPYGLEIGEADDALNAAAEDQSITFNLSSDGIDYLYEFSAPLQQRSLHLPIINRPLPALTDLSASGMAFSYLNAERLGPRDQLSVTSARIPNVGVGERGQFVAQALTLRERDTVPDILRHESNRSVQTLRAHVEAWMTDIVRPIRIDTQWPPGMTTSLIRFQAPGLESQPLRPGNVGFGVSYVLPIIVAGLAVGKGILIVENPEAHLHPAGQSKLGRFLARVAGSSAQVIVETHSDHVLNGIRRGAVDDKSISPSDVIIHYFDRSPDSPLPIDVTSSGGMSEWPQGFFDQFDEDLGRLARAKREARQQESDRT